MAGESSLVRQQDTFDPDGPLTRAQMVTILHRYHKAFPPPTVIDYTEADLALSGGITGDVILRVGTDIQPGVYSVEHAGANIARSCRMYRYSGFQYTDDQVIWEQRFVNSGQAAVEILASDAAVRFENCGNLPSETEGYSAAATRRTAR